MSDWLSEEEMKIMLNAIGKQSLSNCYLHYNEIMAKIKNRELDVLSHKNILLLIQKINEIHKMFYFLKSDREEEYNEDVYRNLHRKMEYYPKLVTDIITKNEQNSCSILENLRYRFYKKYLRFVLSTENIGLPKPSGKTASVDLGDISEVYQLLHQSLDPLSDHLPSEEELRQFIELRQIIKICQDGKIAGVLLFEKQGVKSYLRALCVNSEYRNRGIGYSLMTNYMNTYVDQARMFYLWVESANQSAIRLYEKLGYKPDGLMDTIFLHEDS